MYPCMCSSSLPPLVHPLHGPSPAFLMTARNPQGMWREPCIAMVSPFGWQGGPAHHLAIKWGKDPRNIVIFAERSCQGRTPRVLADACGEGTCPSAPSPVPLPCGHLCRRCGKWDLWEGLMPVRPREGARPSTGGAFGRNDEKRTNGPPGRGTGLLQDDSLHR